MKADETGIGAAAAAESPPTPDASSPGARDQLCADCRAVADRLPTLNAVRCPHNDVTITRTPDEIGQALSRARQARREAKAKRIASATPAPSAPPLPPPPAPPRRAVPLLPGLLTIASTTPEPL
ncbi:MAG TPA: hypothetical protein VHB68_14790 [Steroidobacteraceae bacterium]|nr:hypothetical protein [Steroidobacteraceae bacterium]